VSKNERAEKEKMKREKKGRRGRGVLWDTHLE
jgi:hypothetical protein